MVNTMRRRSWSWFAFGWSRLDLDEVEDGEEVDLAGFGRKIEFWREMLTYYGGNFGRVAGERKRKCRNATWHLTKSQHDFTVEPRVSAMPLVHRRRTSDDMVLSSPPPSQIGTTARLFPFD